MLRAALATTLLVLVTACGQAGPGTAAPATAAPTPAPRYELWALDQADTSPAGGGTLYIFRGEDLAGERPAPAATVNLAEAALGVGDGVGRRPHMLAFNSAQTHGVVANVASGHVYVVRASDRKVTGSVRMTAGAGTAIQAHAALVTPKDDAIVVMNQNGKKLQRASADFKAESYKLDPAADLDLNAAQDAEHPDNAPICALFTSDGRFTLVTLRGGGLYVVDHTATPMKIVGGATKTQLGPNGCGGLANGGDIWINAGGGTAGTPTANRLFHIAAASVPTVTITEVASRTGNVDAHGALLTPDGKTLWMADRFANRIDIFDAKFPGASLVKTLELASGPLAGKDPAPDLIDIAPDGTLAFVALRGKEPLTGNLAAVNNAVGDSPGVAVLRVLAGGRDGEVKAYIPFALAGGATTVDAHGLRVRTIR